MAGKEISVKKYVVRLSSEEREQLETLIRNGATAGSLPPWTPAHPWSTACVSNWWKKASRRF